MMNVFEKIRKKFENIHRVVTCDEDLEWNRAVYKCETLVNQVEQEHNNGWIKASIERPSTNRYILLSFYNFSIPQIGRYEENEDGGAFYIGDDTETCVSQDLFVNAWMELPEPYKERDTNGN